MARKPIFGVAAIATAVALVLAGCSGGSASTTDDKAIAGSITVLTQRTDLVDNVLLDYKKAFEKKYPKVKVTFEAITDYEGEVAIRMNTNDYGDVLMIPRSVTKDKLANYFVPLGKQAALSKKYLFTADQSFDGTTYGIATVGNAQGYVYNTKVWADAGIKTAPTTPEEFISDLKDIKAKTSAIPLYTNYKDGWPMSQWQGDLGFSGPDASNKLTSQTAPWTKGNDMYTIDSLLYNVVHDGLIESDPSTTNWENSKGLIGTGKVATMVLGSWSIVQMQDAAVKAGGKKSDIGYYPFPVQAGGKFESPVGGDYQMGINIHSSHKAAARAWIDWFTADSGFAQGQGGISPIIGGALPDTLSSFKDLGVKFVQLDPAPKGQEALQTSIANAAEIDLGGNVYRQKLVDIARGAAPGDMASYFDELNSKWKAAVAEAG
jgi:raffinose/stachyose/melibiose transport system substrate-binding protein